MKTLRPLFFTIFGALLALAAMRAPAFDFFGKKPAATNAPPAEAEAPARPVTDSRPLERGTQMTTSFAPVVKRVAPSVVNVYTSRKVALRGMGGNPLMEEMLREFFGLPEGAMPRRRGDREFGLQRGQGSGVIVSRDGHILTNNHVVDEADEVRVKLNGSAKEHTAKVVGRDAKTDIAVLKIEAGEMPAIAFADSDKVEIGDIVLAIGNPFGLGQSVTMGVISALSRYLPDEMFRSRDMIEDFIQTDAPINPGNSGGALVDAEGRLVGVNTAILGPGGNIGVGFAVPANLARTVMERILKDGRVRRGYIGVGIQEVTPELAEQFKMAEPAGALIGQVMDGGAGAAAGIKPGDIITHFNGRTLRDSRQLRVLASQAYPGTQVKLKLLRDGKEMEVAVTLKEAPEEESEESAEAEPGDLGKGSFLKGVDLQDLTSEIRGEIQAPADLKGAVVASVAEGSSAARAGLQRGDVIVEVNRRAVANAKEASASDDPKRGGALLRVWRAGRTVYLVVPSR